MRTYGHYTAECVNKCDGIICVCVYMYVCMGKHGHYTAECVNKCDGIITYIHTNIHTHARVKGTHGHYTTECVNTCDGIIAHGDYGKH